MCKISKDKSWYLGNFAPEHIWAKSTKYMYMSLSCDSCVVMTSDVTSTCHYIVTLSLVTIKSIQPLHCNHAGNHSASCHDKWQLANAT